ncbi:hypothetical protein RB595_002070 [Gaeumannomyces hyphopodioides]
MDGRSTLRLLPGSEQTGPGLVAQTIMDSEPARKRLRVSHACDNCRGRKIRCDGNTPCAACAAADCDCTYGSEANSGKSDLILEGVLRVERFLHEMNATMASIPLSTARTIPGGSVRSSSFSGSPLAEVHPVHTSPSSMQPTPASEPHNPNSLENAVLDSMHTSTTESILQWPHLDVFPSLRQNYVPIFPLEQRRPPLRGRATSMLPCVAPDDVDAVLSAFQAAVNFWYPTTSLEQVERCRRVLVSAVDDSPADADDGVDACLAYVVMALGCASQVVAGLTGEPLSDNEMRFRRARRKMGDLFFDNVLKRLHVVHAVVGSTATHCLFLVGLYFAFLRRPLQAWEYINAASTRCLLLLSYQSDSGDGADQERIRRIFWSCYILESDYLAELSGLPQSGIARIESSVPLPGSGYGTHRTEQAEEQSSLYFLACISMRRLLNRVHQLLYARGTGASLDPARFPFVVAELDHQLEEWRDVLPVAFAFTLDARPCASEHGGFLRQRYLTCRSVIYRPYLMWMLSGVGDAKLDGGDATALRSTRACLDACLLHMLNLRGFCHTVLVDTWICALSMAGAMCLLLAACRTPSLKGLLLDIAHDQPDVLACGEHLGRLFRDWQAVSGDPASPSVEQSVRIVAEADRFIRELAGNEI